MLKGFSKNLIRYSVSSARAAKPWRLLLPLLGLLLLGIGANAQITLKLSHSEGDKVSDTAKIVATAESGDGIDKVEFLVDDQLRYTDTSTPYEFSWDTIEDTEGAHVLSVIAYDSNMRTKRIKVPLTIDNELGMGANALAQHAQEAISAKDTATAMKFCRRALKSEPGNTEAARALASLYAAKSDWDKAITTLEKAKNLDENTAALHEMASYRIRKALLPENAATFITELQAVAELRRKAGDHEVTDITKRTPDAHEAIGDALFAAGRFHEAAMEYGKKGQEENAPLPLVSRYGLALIMEGRAAEAITLTRPLVKIKKADAACRAVYGLALLNQREFAKAREAVQQDLADHAPSSLIIAAYADSVLRKRRDAMGEAKDAVSLIPNAGEAHFALAMSSNDSVESEKAVNQALALAPFQHGPYLDYACRVAISKRLDRNDQALNVTDYVLKSDPNSVYAKMIQALVYLQSKRLPESEQLINYLAKKEPMAPDVLMLLAVYWGVKDNGGLILSYMTAARKASPEIFDMGVVPTPGEYIQLLNRRIHYRAAFFLTPASLYPEKN